MTSADRTPRVDIIYAVAGDDAKLAEAAVKAGAKGLVSASMGNCSIPNGQEAFYEPMMAKGFPVVLSSTSRRANGAAPGRDQEGLHLVGQPQPQEGASAPPARFLTKTQDIKEIQRIFNEY